MSSAGKLVMFAVLLALVTVVSGECEEKCRCTKYKVFCSVARLGALPTNIPNTVEFVKIELDNIPRISSIVGLQNITHLQLIRVDLWEIEPGAFQNVSRLEYLAITGNELTLLKTDSFKYLHELYLLNLTNNAIRTVGRGTFGGLKKIRVMDLTYNNIIQLETAVFEGMKINQMNAVEYENLFRHSTIEPAAFKYISTLTYFHLSQSFYSNPIPKHVSFGVRTSKSIYDVEYVNRNNKLAISDLLYLDLSQHYLQNLKELQFPNFTKLKYLDLSWNGIFEIISGYFEGLVSLQALIMNNNHISHLNNGTFHGLQSLEILNVSYSRVSRIESRAFEGLSKLRILDLSRNEFHSLSKSAFSSLRMLKELTLEGNAITHIDYTSFCGLTNLKTLLNSPFYDYYFRGKHDIEHIQSINTVSETTFVEMQRLDNLRLFLRIKIPKEIQVLNALHLYIHAGYDDPENELRRVLQTVRYIRSLSVALSQVKSIEFLPTLPEFRISELTLSFTDSIFVNVTNLFVFRTLKSLTVYFTQNVTMEEGAFRGMQELKELSLYYEFNFTITHGLFLGLENLKLLTINCQNCNLYSPRNWKQIQSKINYIDSGVFLGMDNLTELVLSGNDLTHLKPGAFRGLNKIEKIDLSGNGIGKMEAGVFGAICKDDFEISCKNVTLPEYCNDTNALRTLKYLYLKENYISKIHPHAFVSCTNLETLDLSFNEFLILDIPFLYTPGLRKLKMSWCSITNIPNETFACTPLLSEIDFNSNKKLDKLTFSALLPLNNLQNIHLWRGNLSCDCEFYETWKWLRQHRVNYALSCRKRKQNIDTTKDVEAVLSTMICSSAMINISSQHNRTSDTKDFAFFKQYVEPILLIIILTFGLVSNGFLLFIALRHTDMRTKHNACIIHLSTVELLSLVLNLPLSYWDVVNIRWEFDDALCKIYIFSKDVGVAVTAFSTVVLSVERFLVARNFGDFRKMCKSETQPTAWLLLMTWISGIVTSLPAYLSAGVFEGRCLYCPPGNQSYIRNVWTFQFVMYCLSPASAIPFLNVKTCLFLRASIRKMPGEIKENDRTKNRRKVANVALILVLVFIVSYLPNYMLRLLVAWSLVDMKDLFLPSFITFCLFFCYAIFNPISVFIMSSKFKSYAFRYFPFLENFELSRPVPLILDGNVRRHKKSGG